MPKSDRPRRTRPAKQQPKAQGLQAAPPASSSSQRIGNAITREQFIDLCYKRALFDEDFNESNVQDLFRDFDSKVQEGAHVSDA